MPEAMPSQAVCVSGAHKTFLAVSYLNVISEADEDAAGWNSWWPAWFQRIYGGNP